MTKKHCPSLINLVQKRVQICTRVVVPNNAHVIHENFVFDQSQRTTPWIFINEAGEPFRL